MRGYHNDDGFEFPFFDRIEFSVVFLYRDGFSYISNIKIVREGNNYSLYTSDIIKKGSMYPMISEVFVHINPNKKDWEEFPIPKKIYIKDRLEDIYWEI